LPAARIGARPYSAAIASSGAAKRDACVPTIRSTWPRATRISVTDWKLVTTRSGGRAKVRVRPQFSTVTG
jgi:hypothetical protein